MGVLISIVNTRVENQIIAITQLCSSILVVIVVAVAIVWYCVVDKLLKICGVGEKMSNHCCCTSE